MSDLISRQAAIDAMLGDKVQITDTIRALGGERDFEVLNCTCDRHAQIIKDLPPVQPTQTNCEYCHTDRDGYVLPLEKNCHAFIDRDKIVLKANGWRGEAKIKYCPICGRRLTDGTD